MANTARNRTPRRLTLRNTAQSRTRENEFLIKIILACLSGALDGFEP